MFEYELKYVGPKVELEKLLEVLVRKHTSKLLKTQTYLFDTVYYDQDKLLHDQGYTLRTRGQNSEAGYEEGSLELKALDGVERGVSKRLELSIHGGSMDLSSYFSLLAHKSCPDCVRDLKFFNIEPLFTVTTERMEIACMVKFAGQAFEVEFVLDRVNSWKYDAIGRKRKILDEYYELEIEVKGGPEESIPNFLCHFGDNLITRELVKNSLTNVSPSCISKAKRVFEKQIK